jgi:hypothetical protein
MDMIWDNDNYTDAMMILMEDDSDNKEEDVGYLKATKCMNYRNIIFMLKTRN